MKLLSEPGTAGSDYINASFVSVSTVSVGCSSLKERPVEEELSFMSFSRETAGKKIIVLTSQICIIAPYQAFSILLVHFYFFFKLKESVLLLIIH